MSPVKLSLLLIALLALEPTRVIGFDTVVFDNTTGTPDTRFAHEIGTSYTSTTLFDASEFVWGIFQQTLGERKSYTSVEATITSFEASGIRSYPLEVGIIRANLILLNADYVQAYVGDVKAEFTGILYHESARVWQWTAYGTAPIGLITGIADYVRLVSGWPSKGWVPRGSGSRWDEGYAVTAYFLEYCNGVRDGFVADLNAGMEYYYSDAFFVQLLGKSVYELWNDYKLQYGDNSLAAAVAAPAAAPFFGY